MNNSLKTKVSSTLKSKVFTTNWDAWNNKWVPIVATPFLIVLGVVIGTVLSVYLASSELGQTLVMGLFLGVIWIAGYTLIGLVDQHVTGVQSLQVIPIMAVLNVGVLNLSLSEAFNRANALGYLFDTDSVRLARASFNFREEARYTADIQNAH